MLGEGDEEEGLVGVEVVGYVSPYSLSPPEFPVKLTIWVVGQVRVGRDGSTVHDGRRPALSRASSSGR